MGSSFTVRSLIAPCFAERLHAFLSNVREELGLSAIAILELRAEHGRLAPAWTGTVPEARRHTECSFTTFRSLFEGPALRPPEDPIVGSLGAPFADSALHTASLQVYPKLATPCDTLLLYAGPTIDVTALGSVRACLEEGLSHDRKLRLAQTIYRAVEQAPDPFELTDREARLFYANPAWERAFGYRVEQAVGQTVGQLLRDPVDPMHDPAFYQFTLSTIAKDGTWLGSLACRTNEGQRVFIEANVGSFDADEQGFQGNVAIRRDTAHRLDRDEALAVSHREFRTVLSAIPDGVTVLRDGKIYFANRAFLVMVGMSEQEVIGRPFLDFVHPDDREQFQSEYETAVARVRVMNQDGSPRFAEITTAGAVSFEAKPAMILLSRDTTDYRVTQEQLSRAEKLSALGSLAAGVAHEINNPLAYLSLNLEQIRNNTQADPSFDHELIDEAIDGADRIRRIVLELRGFSSSDGPVESVSVVKATTSAINIAQNEIRHRARLVRQLEENLYVMAREGQLVQVLINILVNAAQAIPMQDDISRNTIRVVAKRASDDRARILISDTGTGIPESALAKVFEPFTTSKRRGEGSGLGLAISKRILDSLDGQIRIMSRLGEGTTVVIELPRAQPPLIAQPKSQTTAKPAPSARARVLIVDDEWFLAKGLKRALAPHEVLIARNGTEALQQLERDTDFDLILCDLMMPGVTGMQLHKEACSRSPELGLRFVFMTGGTFTEKSRAFIERGDVRVLNKPFDITRVIRWLEESVSVRNANHGTGG